MHMMIARSNLVTDLIDTCENMLSLVLVVRLRAVSFGLLQLVDIGEVGALIQLRICPFTGLFYA